MGNLIVIEGLDGSGKTTQVGLLPQSLAQFDIQAKRIKLPNYDDESSALVKMYLAGQFGDTADGLSAYAASSFYAVDRIASYRKYWQADYERGTLILADRYTTSNAIYQMNKLPQDQWDDYLEWLADFEYHKLCLPKPDLVIYLDVPIECSKRLLEERYNGDVARKDIHERDILFLNRCYRAAQYAIEKCGWQRIDCMKNGVMRDIAEIQLEMIKMIRR